MITRLLRYVSLYPIQHPKLVIAISLVLTAISLVFIPRLHVTTDRNVLAGTDNPIVQRRQEIYSMFGTSFVGIILLEGADNRRELQTVADELAVNLSRRDDLVGEVFHRAEIDFFEQHALLFLEPDQIARLGSILEQTPDVLETLARGGHLGELVASLGEALQAMPEPEGKTGDRATNRAEPVKLAIADLEQWFAGASDEAPAITEKLNLRALAQGGGLDEDGYLSESDGKSPPLAVLFVQPASTSQSIDVVAPFTDFLRAETAQVLATHPTFQSHVTGLPAMSRDEMRYIRKDSITAGAIAGLGVFLVFMLAFRSWRIGLFLFAPLGVGLIWTTGMAAFFYGYLTMITAYFAAILFGLGVAFTIHVISRFHEALRDGEDVPTAAQTAVIKAGPGVLVGGGTTAFAFWAIILSDFKGFAEMGVISGIGIAFILIANGTVLPAALVLWHPGRKIVSEAQPRRDRRAFWVKIARSRWVLPALALGATIAGAFLAKNIEFDYALENMLPSRAESVKGLALLNDRTEFTSAYSVAVADSLEEAEQMRQAFEALSTVERADSVSQFVPSDQPARLKEIMALSDSTKSLLERAAHALNEYNPQESKLTAGQLADGVLALSDSVEDLAFDAKRAGRSEAAMLTELKSSLRKLEETLRKLKSNDRPAALEAQLYKTAAQLLSAVSASTRSGGFAATDLPVQLRRRFISKDGTKYAVLIHPGGDTGDGTFLERHVAQLASVAPDVSGHQVGNYHFAEMIMKGFKKAVLLAAFAVVLLILLDIRSPQGLALALVPVAFAAGWTALFMALTGFKLNYANLMALPILIGTGVDYGVHLAHRAKQEGSVVKAAQTTGKAIALSGLTTLIGFGSLVPSTHWGMRSLGLLLVFGIFSALVVALIILPGFFRRFEQR